VGVLLRPALFQFLKEVSKLWDIIVFTAGKSEYANAIAKWLDPSQNTIKAVYSRPYCFRNRERGFSKDLRILGHDLDSLVIVDNLAASYAFQLKNGIPIIPFFGSKSDNELPKLSEYLNYLASLDAKDMIEYNSNHFKSIAFRACSSIKALYKELRHLYKANL